MTLLNLKTTQLYNVPIQESFSYTNSTQTPTYTASSQHAYQTSLLMYMPVLGCAQYLQNGCSDYNLCLGPSSLGLMPFDGPSLGSLDNTL